MRERSDGALVRAARLGDAEAFAQIVDRHGPAMRRYARFLLGDEEDASDATQEALVSAWRDLRGFQGRSALRTWLFTLVSRRAADLQRRRKPVPIDDTQLEQRLGSRGDLAVEGAVELELLSALRQALQELSMLQRSSWLLREVEGLSYQEIADTLSISVDSVRGLLSRARVALAARMEAWR